jgi:predicted heme/steroid binding protein
MRIFTREELKRYDGKGGPAYIAYSGKVYDVSQSFHWKKGKHHVTHRAGCDLTEALKKAPHSADMLEKFPTVGELVDLKQPE